MKFVLFERSGAGPEYGIVSGESVVPLEQSLSGDTPQEQLQWLIDSFDALCPRLETLLATGGSIPLSELRLVPPVPRPGKIVLTTATYDASAQTPALLATLKSAESVIGPGGVVQLPEVDDRWQFVPQAALGLVICGSAKDVPAAEWQRAVFGYTCVIDVMAHPATRSGADQTVRHPAQPSDQQFGRDFWLAKANTLGPLGPCIVTVDEIDDPTRLHVHSWQNGTPAQDFLIADASHSIAEQVGFVTMVMTLYSGDVLVCGSSSRGQRQIADGDSVQVEIDGIGRLAINVRAPAGSAV